MTAQMDVATHAIDSATPFARTVSDAGAALTRRLRKVVSLRAHEPLAPALASERKTMRTHRGAVLSYYEDRHKHGEGRPLVLVHSVNACASAAEMRPLFEHYRGERAVYAVDLPGFGLSERGALAYSPEAYAAELVDFFARIKDRDGEAPDVVALSLGCELVARAAHARKDLVHLLTFLSPTGLGREARQTRPLASRVLSPTHWWSPLLFQAIASRPSIRYFLKKSFVGPVDAKLREYDYETSHQPGAEYAPLAFLCGKLFTPDVMETYAGLDVPVLVLYDKDGYVGFERLDELLLRAPLWAAKRIAPTRGMPHFERLDETTQALSEFWGLHTGHR